MENSRDTVVSQIHVMQAYVSGKPIKCIRIEDGETSIIRPGDSIVFDLASYDFNVAVSKFVCTDIFKHPAVAPVWMHWKDSLTQRPAA